jgi:NADH-quinone oxidoreductase subunit M
MFYVFFEAILIPMFFMIGIWGSHGRNIHAAFVFFLYTLFGSLLMLLGLVYLHTTLGTTSFLSFTDNSVITATEDKLLPYIFNGDMNVNLILFVLFFIAFAVKIPMFPAHIWLPEAHGEAPTVGSVILAGLLLKLGLYGMIRVLLPLCIPSILALKSFVYLLCLISIIYTSLTTLAQTDIKRVIAYSSVGHMNMSVLALFSLSKLGFVGAVFSGISHGFVASGLFFCVGLLYDRFGTKLISYFGGVAVFMPVFASIFGFFSFANIAFPGTSAFASEFLMLTGIGSLGFVVLFLASLGVLLSAFYSIWLMNRILFGPYTSFKTVFSSSFSVTRTFSDLTKTETFVLLSLVFAIILFGIYPSLITDLLNGFSFNFLIAVSNNLIDFEYNGLYPILMVPEYVYGTDISQARFEYIYLGGARLPVERLAEFAQWKLERIEFRIALLDMAQRDFHSYFVSREASLDFVRYLNLLETMHYIVDFEDNAHMIIETYNLQGQHYTVIEAKFHELWMEEALKFDPRRMLKYIWSQHH